MSNLDKPGSPEDLMHFGVKGMRWGIRRSATPGVHPKVDRDAKKDAHEFARAKLFYGEGAGTRRKLIKATVESKSKKDPSYKKAFDNHFSKQDLGTHASKAQGERKRKNAVNSAKKTTRGISHLMRGNAQYASAAAALLFGGAMYAHKKGIDRVILNAGKATLSQMRNSGNMRAGMGASEFLRNMGVS